MFVINGLAVINSNELVITDAQSALDLIATVGHYHHTISLIIPKAAVTESFFKLSTGVAGEVLQKFSNYGARIAIVGDFSGYDSKPLQDFIFECNNGCAVFFAATEAEAIFKLSKV